MSSLQPSSFTYSLPEFARNGSQLRSNRSGWGIAYSKDKDVMVVKEAKPADDSPWVRFIAEQEIESKYVIAHVRYATRGGDTLENTHPFRRIILNQVHVFAHNGTLKGIEDFVGAQSLSYQPVGETDSELAFCLLLDRVRTMWQRDEAPPSLKARMEVFLKFSGEMAKLGSANFLYFDGDCLFAHAHKRIYEQGGQYTEARAPGLQIKNCRLCAAQPEYECQGLKIDFRDQQTILVASVPLDDFGWEPLPGGTAIAIQRGKEMLRESTL